MELETFCFRWERVEAANWKVSIFLLLWIKIFIWTHLFLFICNLNLNLWKLKPFVLDPKEDWRQIGKVSLNRRWTLYMYEETAIVNVVKSKWLTKSGCIHMYTHMYTHNSSFLMKTFSEYKDKTNVCSDEDKDSPQASLFIVFRLSQHKWTKIWPVSWKSLLNTKTRWMGAVIKTPLRLHCKIKIRIGYIYVF